MAEALIEVADPLASLLTIGPDAPLDRVRASLIRGLAPVEANCGAPEWLLADQVAPFQRAVAAIERYRGVLLADPVGSGKTWIALAVAKALGHSTVAIVPASLKGQWQRVADQVDLPLSIHSHEALSRGSLPAPKTRFVIIDESHRFRTPTIRRYRELGRWLVGRRIMLLSATPVVNQLGDLTHQLALGIRDDALATRGIPSLAAMLESGTVTGALGDLVLCRAEPSGRPQTRNRVVSWTVDQSDWEILDAIDRLALSSDRGIAGLIRMTLWRAMASSRAALTGALNRYAGLLDHATQAAALGRCVTRAEIKSFTDGALDQLVMWEVLPALSSPAELVLDDRRALDRLIGRLRAAEMDPRITALKGLLPDDKPTLVFTSSRDTLEALRSELGTPRTGWVSGSGAGIGHLHLDRESVLDHFRPDAGQRTARQAGPLTVLLTTDLAAEGLNLQLAERVVHFDLPWTSVRIDQREGRAVRLGSCHTEVEIVEFSRWDPLEQRLRQVERLVHKRRLATAAGLDDSGRWLYRWRADLSEGVPQEGTAGFAVARGDRDGWLIGLGFDLRFADGSRQIQPAGLTWIGSTGEVVEDPQFLVQRLKHLGDPVPPTEADRQTAVRVVLQYSRQQLRVMQQTSWLSRPASVDHRRLVRRMRRVASEAARARSGRMLELADRALDWLAGGVTAGEALYIAELNGMPTGRLAAGWQKLLREPRQRPVPVVRLTGIVRVTTFPPCQTSAPCCSTSTAP